MWGAFPLSSTDCSLEAFLMCSSCHLLVIMVTHSCQKNTDVFWKLENFPETPTLNASASIYLQAYSKVLFRFESTKVIFPMFCRIFSCMKQWLVESRNCICKLCLMTFGQLVYQQPKLSIMGISYLMTLLYLATSCTW